MTEAAPRGNQRALIQMTTDEVDTFLGERHSMGVSTIGADDTIHAVAMWYGVVDGRVAFVTKRKSQKVANLGRDQRMTCLIEAGESYGELRGVSLAGHAEVVDDPMMVEAVARSVFDRYGDGSGEFVPAESVRGRVAVFCVPTRVVSWDHRKLGRTPERLQRVGPKSD